MTSDNARCLNCEARGYPHRAPGSMSRTWGSLVIDLASGLCRECRREMQHDGHAGSIVRSTLAEIDRVLAAEPGTIVTIVCGDVKPVVLSASPEPPRNEFADLRAASSPPIHITNHFDASALLDQLTSPAGQEAVRAALRDNPIRRRAERMGMPRETGHTDDRAMLLPPGAVVQHVAFLAGTRHVGGVCCQDGERCPGCGGINHSQPIFSKRTPPEVIDTDDACERCMPERWGLPVAKAPPRESWPQLRAQLDVIARAPAEPLRMIDGDTPPRPDGFDQRQVDAAKAALLAPAAKRGGR